MGGIYAQEEAHPQSAMALLGDFAFLAGKPSMELVSFKPDSCKQNFIIMVPQNEAWAKMIEECYLQRAKKVCRYAIKKEPDIFDRERLKQAAGTLPPEYEMRLIDEALFWKCKQIDWCRDLTSQYDDYETYQRLGLGVMILRGSEPVTGASSYARYKEGIEIEIDTKEAYRRKGLAYACGARLILECLDRGLYPSWDAQNPWSVALAQKLGYHYSHDYTAYEIRGY